MDLRNINYLPTQEPLDPSNPSSGYMQRPMADQDQTDGGIIDRIKQAASQGLIHPKVADYLMENLLDDDMATNQAIAQMPSAPMQPMPQDIVSNAPRNGLLGGQPTPQALQMETELRKRKGLLSQ